MESTPYWKTRQVSVLEAEVDDMTGEALGHVLQRAMAAGALDIFHTPVQMKKNRPGIHITLLCREEETDRFIDFVFRQTTTLGIRVRRTERVELERDWVEVEGRHGAFRMKRGMGPGGEVLTRSPEFDDLQAIAGREDVPLKEVFRDAWSAGSVASDEPGDNSEETGSDR